MSGVFKPYGGVFAIGGPVAGPGLVSSDALDALAVATARLGGQERTPAAGAPPLAPAAGVPSVELDDASATEGDVVAEALAKVGPYHLTEALNHLVAAQCATARASASLALLPMDDPARHRTDPLAVEVHRTGNELGGLVERLLNVGVKP